MQIKIFSIPILGGERQEEELNAFLRSNKIIQMQQQLVQESQAAFWSFCIKYIQGKNDAEIKNRDQKIDYKKVLDVEVFERFSRLREIRKKIAQEEGVPIYVVFTNKQLAGLAKQENITTASMMKVDGIGENKVTKYGKYFITSNSDEKSK